MRSRRSYPLLGLLVVLATALATVAQPEPPKASANIVCDAVGGAGGTISGGIEAIGGAVGGANPIGDACDAVTGKALGAITSPVTDAIEGVGKGIFDQITTWVSEGAGWLIQQVASEIEKTTSPNLMSEGFLAEYGQMAEISAVLAAAMVLLAILEAIAQGSWGLLARAVLVNLPLAFVATSMAFVVVQMLLIATDGMCHGIAAATHEHSQRFFKSAITGLAKAGAGAGEDGGAITGGPATGAVNGAVAAPLFVTFLTAIVGAFAAFFVWLELLAREASIYVVALFLPPTFATAIWPRWSGALRRACELLVVVISSKFVTVTIIALAASLVAAKGGTGIQPLLLASALMLLACFAPFMLLKLVPFAEGAMGAAYGRRSASGGGVSGFQLAYEAQMIQNMARSNTGASPPEVWNIAGGGSGGDSGSGGGSSPRPVGGGGGGSGSAGAPGSSGANAGGATGGASQGAGAPGGAAAGASPAGAAASVPLATARGARSSAGRRLGQSGVAQAASQGSPGHGGGAPGQQERSPEMPASDGASGSPGNPSGTASETPPRPPQELSVKGERKGSK
jgi:type IV secretion system protein TrbL